MENKDKIILDLCGGSGSWSKPYKDAGYDVRLITLPDNNVRIYYPPDNVYGILAAPPCTHFSCSGARYWSQKDKDGRTLLDTQIISRVLMIIAFSRPKFWCIENPVGRLNKWLGIPFMRFDPCDYGDPYTKLTCLWGLFRTPLMNSVKPSLGSKMHLICPSKNRSAVRSITPPGFAKAFFEANR